MSFEGATYIIDFIHLSSKCSEEPKFLKWLR